MKKFAIAVLASAGLFAATAQTAQAREFADIYTDCGLGAMIAPNNSAVAAVTNVTWDLGTTAVSSDASSPDSCKGGKVKKAAFIHDAYPQLAQDLSRGQGAHLQALVAMSGCAAPSQSALMHAVRADFAQLTAAPAYAQQSRFDQAKNLFDAVNQRVASDFAAVCTAV